MHLALRSREVVGTLGRDQRREAAWLVEVAEQRTGQEEEAASMSRAVTGFLRVQLKEEAVASVAVAAVEAGLEASCYRCSLNRPKNHCCGARAHTPG
jgi:hypothetical protein